MLHVEGPLLTVDVGDRDTETTTVDDVLESFIGGRGVATRLAHDRIPFDADPLSEENSLFFTTGPMQTSNMSFTGRTNCTGVSPLTGGLLSSNAGGFISRNLADTGYGAVEITGESDELLAIHVTDEGVEFEAVPDLDGATVPEVTEYMADEHDLSKEHTACIGPAGENLVRFASIMTTESRAFGRGGLGAVLGSKNVKAITFEGDSRRDVDIDPIGMDIHREAATSDSLMKEQGTTNVTDLANEVGALPTRYFSELSFEGVEGINGEAVGDKKYKKGTCSSCAFACKLPTKDEERGVETEGPEYETVMAFGSNCDVDDVVDVMQSNELCDRYGMDTISCGNVVAAYLQSEGEFGNTELVHETVEKIANREDEGDLLAEGIARFHEDLDVENWTVKGLSFAAHDGRTLNGQGLSYAVATRGADHMFTTMYHFEYPLVSDDEALPKGTLEGKPEMVVEQENARAMEDCGIVCRFAFSFMTPERFETIFGEDYDDLLDIGARVVELERHFNNQRGVDRDDDELPYDLPEFESALDEYYELRDWNADGTVPDNPAGESPVSAD
ncbi:aldehyde ferredoxin oxidoreductase family protein [Halorientalis salina]|uniref:aldehyde ferredoxin oxidoreductase family protein n=1 Tax=Halorientalis salina TaxID=2932266 RepID=UPI0010ACEA20|nr:aldehyde ferredoxin oxidoreductase C-terminal domain-containing protein [Halorientalis salina]